MRKLIRWGVLGTGFIANTFATDLALVDQCEIVAVASGSLERAKEFANKYNIVKSYDSYEALAEDSNVDAVYIAGYNTVHKQQTIMCLKAGKAVLCEKPMAMTYNDAKEIIDIAKAEKVLFMEGHWTRFKPTTKKLRALIESGDIGEVRYVQSDFGYMVEADININDRRMDKNKGGGALYDVGVYPLAMANMIFRQKPNTIVPKQMIGESGVDLQSMAFLAYDKGMMTAHCAINALTPFSLFMTTTKAKVYMDDPWFGNKMKINWHDGKEEDITFDNWGRNYTFEIDAFNNALRNNLLEVSEITHEDSLAIMEMVDYIHNN